MGATLTTRVSDELVKGIRYISKVEHLDKSAVVRRLLNRAVREWKIKHALEQYQRGRITIWKAARICDLSLREMLDLAAERGIPFQYTLEDLREDYKAIVK